MPLRSQNMFQDLIIFPNIFDVNSVQSLAIALLPNCILGQFPLLQRRSMKSHYEGADAVVIVVDSIKKDRMDETKEQLDNIIEDGGKEAPILVMANNQDEPNAKSKEDIIEELGLTTITDRKWSKFIDELINLIFTPSSNKDTTT